MKPVESIGWILLTVAVGGVLLCGIRLPRLHHGLERRADARANWITVPGEVLAVGTDRRMRHGVYGHVEYSYVYEGRKYTSDVTSFFGEPTYKVPATLAELKASAKVGDRIPVLVNPAKPSEAVRLPELKSDQEMRMQITRYKVAFGVSVGLAAAGLVLVRARKKTRPG